MDDGPEPPAGPEPLKLALEWSTYWGGQGGYGATRGKSLAVAANGDVIVAGETQNPAFFIKNPAVALEHKGSMGFVTRFAAGGHEIVYSTLLGSSHPFDWCNGVAVDAGGNALVVGLAGGADFPLKNPLYAEYPSDGQCGFLSSIPPNGGGLNFSTLVPHGVPAAVAAGADGSVYVATFNGHVLKFAADGSRLLYDFRFAADDSVTLYGIAVDGLGRAWVAGGTDYSFMPLLNPLQPGKGVHNGEALLARLDPGGKALDFSALLGGYGEEYGQGVACGGDGMVYLFGDTNSTDFPARDSVDGSQNGGWDAFVAKIDPVASRVVWATYIGGDGEDRGRGLALTTGNEVWIAGLTTSHDLPATGSFQDRLAGVKDAFVAKLSADGRSWRAMSYFGGAQTANHSEIGADWCNALGLGAAGRVYLTGETYSSDFPLRDALDPFYNLPKAFVSAFRETP